MYKISKASLNIEEELLVAVYYNNVEKVKWLMEMDCFKPSMVTSPKDFDEVSIPLYWLTICYKYMSRYEKYEKNRKSVDKMLDLWNERFHLDSHEIINLKDCFHPTKMPFIIKDDDKWWMKHLKLEDFINSGATQADFELYKAVNAFDVDEIVHQLSQGGKPDAKVVSKEGEVCSTISLFREWTDVQDYFVSTEESVVENWRVSGLVVNGLQEMVLFLLEENIKNRISCQAETYTGEADRQRKNYLRKFTPSDELKKGIESFIQETDKTGGILTLFDEGRVFVSCSDSYYQHLYAYVVREIFNKAKYLVIRVGGYSYRIAHIVLDLVKEQPKDRLYVEYLSEDTADAEWKERDPRVRIIGMGKYRLDSDMDIVREAEAYDFKTFGNQKCTHTMVYFYVNNIDTGWYDKDGKFCPFYNKNRGMRAFTDVAMIKGFEDIAPATAAACTFTFEKKGDIIMVGGTIHEDRRSRTSSQKRLIESAGIKLLDLTNRQWQQ